MCDWGWEGGGSWQVGTQSSLTRQVQMLRQIATSRRMIPLLLDCKQERDVTGRCKSANEVLCRCDDYCAYRLGCKGKDGQGSFPSAKCMRKMNAKKIAMR